MTGGQDPRERLLGLLGLACRAGRLALGARAVAALVARGRRPLVILARDAGAAQRDRLLRLSPVRRVVAGAVGREDLARALGRRELVVVAVADPSFVRGIERLDLAGMAGAEGAADKAGSTGTDSSSGVSGPRRGRGRR